MDGNTIVRDQDGKAWTVDALAQSFADRIRTAFEEDKAEGRIPPEMTLQEALEAMVPDGDDAA